MTDNLVEGNVRIERKLNLIPRVYIRSPYSHNNFLFLISQVDEHRVIAVPYHSVQVFSYFRHNLT